ncbi:MAG: hypothetical protein OXR07_04045 [Nitrospira sp.]|nr:hypothetical protein [Nitrospira sp.]MDD9860817.1 hypothetical protein [Nitrospira sp.]
MQLLYTSVIIVSTIIALNLTGCAGGQQKPQMTPLEVQSIQTREFESSKKIVFASVISVFQDLGYTIKSADHDTGLINAESTTQQDTNWQLFAGVGVILMEQTVATAFVEEIRDRTRVRLNFVTTTQSSSAYGQNSREDVAILDATVYTNAFERIENAIFIRSGE